jgi:invasion protein IalB
MRWTMRSDQTLRAGLLAGLFCLSLGMVASAEMQNSATPQRNAPVGPASSAPSAKTDSVSAVDAQPTSTVATFGDWVLRCQRVGSPPTEQRVCEVAQEIRAENQSPVAELAIGHVKKDDPMRLTMILPLNVTLTNAPTFSTSADATVPPEALAIAWRKCLRGGCIADAAVMDEALRHWRAQAGTGRIVWTDADGRDLAIGVSFRGLSQSLDALSKESH